MLNQEQLERLQNGLSRVRIHLTLGQLRTVLLSAETIAKIDRNLHDPRPLYDDEPEGS